MKTADKIDFDNWVNDVYGVLENGISPLFDGDYLLTSKDAIAYANYKVREVIESISDDKMMNMACSVYGYDMHTVNNCIKDMKMFKEQLLKKLKE